MNNDEQAVKKVGKVVINQDDRAKILGALKDVDDVFVSIDKDVDISNSLSACALILMADKIDLTTVAFFNSGDRQSGNPKELKVCAGYGINVVYLPMEKVDSSTRIRSLLGE